MDDRQTLQPANAANAVPTLNQPQLLNLRVSCEYMDKMLQQVEAVLRSPESISPFSQYAMDMSPAQRRVMQDYIARFRSQILRVLAWQGIVPEAPRIPTTRAISTRLNFIQIAISDLRPHALRGSGPIAEPTASELVGVLKELSSIVGQMMSYVQEDAKESLRARIEKLAEGVEAVAQMRRIEDAVETQGLVEFRPRMDALLARLESPAFEVAVFGRVSTGKSSFLNALLEASVLPVGTNPITAVPTRIQYGAATSAWVRFGNRPPSEISVEELRALISEAGNPGNTRDVRQALLALPAPRLAQGIVLVDTPGLGSLALRGTQETLAYLPSCDLALMLVDAGTTLTLEDIGTLRLLMESGIATKLLLSKADLLHDVDREASLAYVAAQTQEQLGSAVPVYPVSTVGERAALVSVFYAEVLEPAFRESQMLRGHSLTRKLVRLQADVVMALEARVQTAGGTTEVDADVAPELETRLMHAASRLATAERRTEDAVLALGFRAPAIVEHIAQESASAGRTEISLDEAARAAVEKVQGEVGAVLEALQRDVQDAVAEIAAVGKQLGRSTLPDEEEMRQLVREAPRFEMSMPAGQWSAGAWTLFGRAIVRRRMLSALRLKLEPMLQRELRVYSAALGIWAKNVAREVGHAVDSFADAYRTALQRGRFGTKQPPDNADAQRALDTLLESR